MEIRGKFMLRHNEVRDKDIKNMNGMSWTVEKPEDIYRCVYRNMNKIMKRL